MIYADNAATTKISDLSLEKMVPFLSEQFGNASSQYSFGTKARRAIEQVRQQIADVICAQPTEIIFNSGGSEGNNWILQGVLNNNSGSPVHVITSSVEHHSVLNTCFSLRNFGVRVTCLPVDDNGLISLDDVMSAVRPETRLVSIMLANNETGTIQPISEIGKFLRENRILFHTDAVQAMGHIPVNIKELNVDFLTASAHKFNGTKGVGFVYVRSGLSLPPLIIGGKQESGTRAGTENVAGIVAMGTALCENVSIMAAVREVLTTLTKVTAEGLKATIPNVRINARGAERLPGILNMTFPEVSGEAIMHLLDMKGICVSTSSACNSGDDTPSHVLLAMGLTEKESKSSIRVSYGRYNTLQDAKTIVKEVSSVYQKLQSLK